VKARNLAVLGLFLAAAGCYHTTVDTGKTPGPVVIEKPWAHSFVAGLVPIETVETASECPNGVAKVETEHSFLNMVANALTFGIYTPMSITVTCAAGAMEEAAAADAPVVDAQSADAESLSAALDEAALRSWERQGPVYVRAID
jgi:hypothetical protein